MVFSLSWMLACCVIVVFHFGRDLDLLDLRFVVFVKRSMENFLNLNLNIDVERRFKYHVVGLARARSSQSVLADHDHGGDQLA
jgi:hypothetical protein